MGVVVNANGQLAVGAYDSSAVTLLGFADQQAGLASQTWVGIGTSVPKAALDVAGDVLVENADQFKVQATHLELGSNASALGSNSVAIGQNTTASGSYSTALGYNTRATGDYSTAMGNGTRASGLGSTAWAGVRLPAGISRPPPATRPLREAMTLSAAVSAAALPMTTASSGRILIPAILIPQIEISFSFEPGAAWGSTPTNPRARP